MGSIVKGSLHQRVLESLRRRGQATIDEVLADVGRHVPSAWAMSSGRTYRRAVEKRRKGLRRARPECRGNLETIGRRKIVARVLGGLCKQGDLERASRGVYRVAGRQVIPFPTKTA